jgi:hypothetical protein
MTQAAVQKMAATDTETATNVTSTEVAANLAAVD